MKRLNVDITDELKEVLETYAYSLREPMGVIVEEILRSPVAINAVRKHLKLEWKDRPKNGRPSKKA